MPSKGTIFEIFAPAAHTFRVRDVNTISLLIHPVQYIGRQVLWAFGYGAVAYNVDVVACNIASTDRFPMFLGTLERPGPLVAMHTKTLKSAKYS